MRQNKEKMESILRQGAIDREKRVIESNKRWLEKDGGNSSFNPTCKYSGIPEKLRGK